MSVLRVPSLARCQFWGSPHLPDVSFEGPLTCWMSVLRVPSLAGCQFLEGPLTCLDVMWSLFWSKLDLKMKIWPTSGRFGENCLLKLVLVCLILTQWWNKKKWLYFPFKKATQGERIWGKEEKTKWNGQCWQPDRTIQVNSMQFKSGQDESNAMWNLEGGIFAGATAPAWEH